MSEMQNHTVHFSFDTTPEQAAIIQQKMKNAGVNNKSGFFRAMVLNGYLLRLDLPELREASRQMSILSNNVNQIAKRMNEHGSICETEIDRLVFFLGDQMLHKVLKQSSQKFSVSLQFLML